MIKFSTDSTCDLPKNIIEEYNFAVLPLVVTLGEEEYFDGVNITPDQIYAYVKKSGELPHTAGRSVEDFKQHFKSLLGKDDKIIHCGIGDKLSVCYKNALQVVEELGAQERITIVDSASLSSATGLILIAGANAYKEGKNFDEIVKVMQRASKNIECSFMVDKLDYLYKGGRVSRFAFSVGSLLKIKPTLEMEKGYLINTAKEFGPLKSTLIKYVDFILKKYPNPDKSICLIAHTTLNYGLLEMVINHLKSKNIFESIIPVFAGSVITCHCGEGTLGIMYLTK